MAVDNSRTKEMIDCLVSFVKRVAEDKDATPAELAAMPEVVKILFDPKLHIML